MDLEVVGSSVAVIRVGKVGREILRGSLSESGG